MKEKKETKEGIASIRVRGVQEEKKQDGGSRDKWAQDLEGKGKIKGEEGWNENEWGQKMGI